jgi:tetratricopeptide (TPR) repeat protein
MNIAWGIQRRKENKFDEALNYFIKAKSLNSNDIVLFEELIRLYLQRKDLRKALEEVSAAISEYPLYDVFYSLRGTILSNQGEIDLAEKDFLEAISLNQENASNFNDLGLMYASESMFDKAIITFSKGIVQDKRNEKLFFNRGLCYSYLNNISSAIADLTRAIELTPKNVQFFMLRADLYMKLNNKKKACGDWNSALQLGFRPAKSFLFTNSCN